MKRLIIHLNCTRVFGVDIAPHSLGVSIVCYAPGRYKVFHGRGDRISFNVGPFLLEI